MRHFFCCLLLLAACGDDDAPAADAGAPQDASATDASSPAPVSARFSLAEDAAFFDAPFPIFHRVREDGSLRVADFPNARRVPLLDQLLELMETGNTGFSTNGAVFLPFDGPLDPSSLPPDPAASRAPGASVFLVDVDPTSPERGRRVAIQTDVQSDGVDIYTPPHTLVALPFPGVVLRPGTRYALVATADLRAADGSPLEAPPTLATLLAGGTPPGPRGADAAAAFAPLRAWLDEEGIDPARVIAATVFPTGDPFAETLALRDAIAARPAPPLEDLELAEEYDEFCVVTGRVGLPVYQRGPKPYGTYPSGALVVEDGAPVIQETDEVVVYLTLPKAPMPEAGFPLVLYANGGGGEGRQVIDRTRLDADPREGLGPPGRGPALYYAELGMGALGFPAPLAHERNPEGREGTLDFWNVANLAAFRGNLRQAALDFTTMVAVVKTARLEPALCPGASTEADAFRYDPARLYLQGHSTGGTVGSIVLPLEPELRAGVLSGTGGSWIYNVVDADSPIALRDVARLVLRLGGGDEVDHFDVEMTFFQTVLASTEVMSWGRVTAREPLPEREPRDALFIAGIVDTYHYPRMVHSQGMALGADLVLPAAEETWEEEYALVGLEGITAPATANRNGATVVTLQRAQREGTDGHYVPFEWEDVKRRYACFLASHARDGRATLYDADVDATCAP
ncbi:MAG TPA: hypothetical protein RMH85_15185 [Polyangiaceae bacterium LLY-WYZ-15_(1-7)]|nr:hypothetical protein [Polyangiaceae bacterium LLY-WYZ-15_(1-7)]HJL09842.1 hypothetical protein [Polyangiaceae bacterium LLY-WYZ-15_(1-7)]HJL24848.1 hypothetical protein [Polyangiaceae bacterium LLY-WYZ-15_(1-7)]HJL38907.1 hypothetical protein [Polyangiaceae bacterium LLY-WYZ-15_(1-7)]HJL46577.1 hypothetical protein [Polyangiaceae bacterium LLY-WYZ-15_(1-7)]